MKPPAISAADLMRAFKQLRPRNKKQKRAISEILGFSWPEIGGPRRVVPKPDDEIPVPPVTLVDAPHGPPPPGPEADFEIPQPQSTLDFTLAGPLEAPMSPLQWRAHDTAFSAAESDPSTPAAIEPLLVPHWTRSILSTALSQRTYDGAPDVARIVEMMMRQVIIRELPRLPLFAMARAVQVLLDVGDNMLPFMEDQRGLLSVIRKLAGKDNLEVLKFMGTPLRGAGVSDIDSWKGYRLPATGTQILLLTDLGIARPLLASPPAPPLEWYTFARQLRSGGIQATALVPYPRDRWPPSLRSQLRIVEWDRSTTATSVRFAPQPGRQP